MRLLLSIKIAVLCCVSASSLFAADAGVREGYRRPVVTIPYAWQKPTIDGVINDEEWQGASSFNALQTVRRQISPRQTRFWMMWDEDNLYVAMRSPLRDGERLVQNLRDTTRPINVVFDDSYEIWINVDSHSPDGQPVFFQFLSNFAAARFDVMHEPAVGNSRLGWTANWNPRNRINENNEWEMEVKIPRASMYRTKPFADQETLTFLLARNFKKPWEQNSFEGTSTFAVHDSHTLVRLSKDAPAIHLLRVADPVTGNLGLELASYGHSDGRLVWEFKSDGDVHKTGALPISKGRLQMAEGSGMDFDKVPERPQNAGDFRIRITSADGNTTYLDWASARQFGNLKTLTLDRPDSDDRIDVRLSLNPVDDYVRVTADFIDYDNRDAVDYCKVVVRDEAGNALAEDTYRLDELAYARGIIRLPGLKNGKYSATMTVIGKDGAVLREAGAEFSKDDPAERFKWWNTSSGNIEKVVSPWTPVKVAGQAIEVWGRTMTIGNAGLPGQVTSQGRELLAAPSKLVAELADGRTAEATGTAARFVSTADHRAVAESTAALESLDIKTSITTEFDGMYKVEMTLTPKQATTVKSLRMVLPLKPELVDYVIGVGEGIRSGYHMGFLPKDQGVIWDSLRVDSQPMLVGSFIPYVWIGTPDVGICWFADSDEGWVPNDETPAIQVIRTGNNVDMVFNLISEEFTIDEPRTITFAYQASPARALTGDWRMCTWWCGDTFDWGGGGWVYPDGKGSTIWQSRPNTTNVELCLQHAEKRQAQTLQYLPEGPVRRPNVVPYFEYNTMTDQGEQAYFGEAWKASSGPLWYDKTLADYIIWNLNDWINTCNIDGWYLDNVRPVYCDNIDAGRGYRLPDGRIQPEFNMFIMRDFFLRLRAVWYENGRESKIVNHMTNCMILPWNAPVDVAYDGEHHVIYEEMEKDFMDFWSLERLRLTVPGTWGVNVNFMEQYQGRWDRDRHIKAMRAFTGAVILHDALPTGNALWRQETRRMLAARDRFGINDDNVNFIGYWVENSGLECPTEDVYLACWHKPGRLLIAVVNWGEETVADVKLDLQKLGLPAQVKVWDAEDMSVVIQEASTGSFSLPMERRDYRLLMVEAP